MLVTVDDRKVAAGDIPLYADGVNVHVLLVPRVEFRRTVEGALQGSWIHSFLAKGRLLYTHDPTIEDLFARLASRGRRDTAILMLGAATAVLAIGEVTIAAAEAAIAAAARPRAAAIRAAATRPRQKLAIG